MTEAAGPIAPDAQGKHPMDRAWMTTMVVLGLVVVFPVTYAFGGLALLGICYGSCTNTEETVVIGAFVLVLVGYVWACRVWLRSVRQARRNRPSTRPGEAPKPWPYSTAGSVVAWAAMVLLLLVLVLFVTCFGLLGVFGR